MKYIWSSQFFFIQWGIYLISVIYLLFRDRLLSPLIILHPRAYEILDVLIESDVLLGRDYTNDPFPFHLTYFRSLVRLFLNWGKGLFIYRRDICVFWSRSSFHSDWIWSAAVVCHRELKFSLLRLAVFIKVGIIGLLRHRLGPVSRFRELLTTSKSSQRNNGVTAIKFIPIEIN